MAIRIVPPKIERIPLIESDKRYGAEGTYVDVRRASVEDHERRSAFFRNYTERVTPEGALEVDYSLPIYEMMWLELEMCLAGCNIEDENGNSLIVFENGKVKDSNQMRRALRGLQDPELLTEMHEAVLSVNSMWAMKGKVKVGE